MNITPICKKFHKKPSHFTDNACCQGYSINIETGRSGATNIPDELIPEFLIWLNPTTRQKVLNGVPTATILKEINNEPSNTYTIDLC